MTPLLLAPIGLAALAALIVPLFIHLRRRTEEIPIDFAALRWLHALPRPRRKVRFDELLLLALRLLLIALLALLLARPAMLGMEGRSERFLVAPSVQPAAARARAAPDADLRWIAPGFPALDETRPPALTKVSSLIRQYDAELAPGTPLTIIVPPVLSGVDAEPLRLTRPVKWRIVAAREPPADPPPVTSPTLSVRYAPGADGPVRYFRAAAQAWRDEAQFDASTGTLLTPRDRVLVWLVPGTVPAHVTRWVKRGGTALLADTARIAMPEATVALRRNASGNTLVEGGPLGSGRLLRFTRPLTPSAMPELLDAEFAARLRDLVAPVAPPPARVVSTAFAPTTGIARYALPPRELSSWLGLLIALAFLAERLLATRRRRVSA